MNCITHPEAAASSYCRVCGRAMCDQCKRAAGDSIYCAEHIPSHAPAAGAEPQAAPRSATSGTSPALAFVLGLMPGVGAIYNAQYAKGFVHILVFGLLIRLAHSESDYEPLFGMMTFGWVFYMAFEAYHTAKKRLLGEQVEEFSSLVPASARGAGFPAIPVILIALGLLFLLNNFDVLTFRQVMRFWPVSLIALGIYLLYLRLFPANQPRSSGPEVSHEQQ
jgi:hypothetical protein